jgi:hypothetical protein
MSMDKNEKKINKKFKTKYIAIKRMKISFDSINKLPNFFEFLQCSMHYSRRGREKRGEEEIHR